MIVVFTEQAEREIEAAWAWYEGRAPGLGARLLAEIEVGRDRIREFLRAWQRLTAKVFRFNLSTFPYGLVYLIGDEEIVVVGVGHSRRGPGYWRAAQYRR